jgi:hypothetical protein
MTAHFALAGNLLRAGDVRGYTSIARMYTIEHATKKIASKK